LDFWLEPSAICHWISYGPDGGEGWPNEAPLEDFAAGLRHDGERFTATLALWLQENRIEL
jgi:hypothetical protein